ncbi:MAG: amidinotransferase [Hydrotalea sp. AMD]|uniref:citrulline utilization hydrolase CtlX n=1 Tax=Hydrotalea sp. AMD TaxID=2501297 RepID=UPI001024D04B|nr:arginine deiminase-related protein [Hydrotalea sp. AMD]RWZ90855.1 MAG: amidinotransferase [Hydrotalea sp. AMD]
MQNTSHLLMIRPVKFSFNEQTAVNNAFQQNDTNNNVAEMAAREFDAFAQKLQANGVDVTIVEDTPEPYTPDSIFPNNWISFHEDGNIILYPMFAVNRRAERKPHVLKAIEKKFRIQNKIDLTALEANHQFLEGTGSMVLDRDHKIAYACLSPRTHMSALNNFAEKTGFTTVAFHANDRNGLPIYHTNVMMCVADQFVVVCMESITDENEKKLVRDAIHKTDKSIILISFHQMEHFAGNMLQVQNNRGEKLLIMSTQAYESLTADQIKILENYNRIIHSSLNTIETNGGGSARCMLAEVFLPVQQTQ